MILNNYDAGQTFEVPASGKVWGDALNGKTYKVENGSLALKLPAYGYAVLTLNK
ncbi:hypothetical protein D3C78_1907530 [compost metagenome]